ncbi:hypothetical protein [Engelhardtia mirabilis]|uniref:Uncharacterized protein n=1 Tax=Engelhardtia mirabilis TaxID=2528011 RepID=A0A518BGR9_9BACT|nr:hypothetical protein Pla133_12360 [Planctomycetes bacterium Pla133]QDV00497.1 hypothetical protein Pla86_12360 [Planctomycetes bacterium Pla86]
MIRNILAVVIGLVAGMAVNMALVLLNVYVLYPMPEGTSMQDPEQFNAYLGTLPATAFLVVLAAHLGQSFVGAWTAARLGASRPMALAMIVGALSLAAGVANMMTVDGPSWLSVELPLYLVVAWLAGRMEVRRRAAA